MKGQQHQEQGQEQQLVADLRQKLSLKEGDPAVEEETSSQHQRHRQRQRENLFEDPENKRGYKFVEYRDESQLDAVMSLVGRDLSEPYSSKWNDGFSVCLSLSECAFVAVLFFAR